MYFWRSNCKTQCPIEVSSHLLPSISTDLEFAFAHALYHWITYASIVSKALPHAPCIWVSNYTSFMLYFILLLIIFVGLVCVVPFSILHTEAHMIVTVVSLSLFFNPSVYTSRLRFEISLKSFHLPPFFVLINTKNILLNLWCNSLVSKYFNLANTCLSLLCILPCQSESRSARRKKIKRQIRLKAKLETEKVLVDKYATF